MNVETARLVRSLLSTVFETRRGILRSVQVDLDESFLFVFSNIAHTFSSSQVQQRPQLAKSLSTDTFREYYWLKTELLHFCREQGLGTTGNKAELAHRVEHYLRTGGQAATSRGRKISGSIPDEFDLDTVIGVGWRCTRALRAFFTKHLGSGFRFNAVMRQFIHEQPGRTLADAIAAYHEDKLAAKQSKIGAQFEYNRFTREFWPTHPDANRDDLLAAWYEYRDTPKSRR